MRRVVWRVRYLLVGGVLLVAAVDLIGWHFWGGRGEVLKPNDGPVVTVTDFGPSFPLDPPLRVATSGILDAFAHDDGPHGQRWNAEHAVRNT
jgi:hypothetical protein